MGLPPFFRHRFLSRFRLPLALLAFTVTYGTVGYRVLEGWSWLDSLYMTMITLTTVGYREVQPLDSGGQLFTISLLAMGVFTLLSRGRRRNRTAGVRRAREILLEATRA
jgi:voltage-gated potassium channel